MKILFICGSFEPGRDGVGDYTRQLAFECIGMGNECRVVALHEYNLPTELCDLTSTMPSLRLPASLPWSERIAKACKFQEHFSPDWVSWQLVSYGIDSRGLVPLVLQRNAGRFSGPHCHVMAHELWLGLETTSTWKARILGWQQRRDVLGLLDALNPSCMHTSNSPYQAKLGEVGYAASLLELFGNIPVSRRIGIAAEPLERWLPPELNSRGGKLIVAVTFGTLHAQWEATAAATWMKQTALRHRNQPVVIAIGRLGRHASATFKAFASEQIPIAATGELSADEISEILQAADFGIAPHSWAIIGKSGAAAAMIDHGLPVLVPRNDWILRGKRPHSITSADPLLCQLEGLTEIRTDRWLASKRKPAAGLPQVARTFLSDLVQAVSLSPVTV